MHKCDYCGELKEYTEKFGVKQICTNCKEIVNKSGKIIVNKKTKKMSSPLDIKKELDKYVIKQEDAKAILATETYNHLKRSNIKELSNIEKNNILLIGPSGSGKTHLVKTLCNIINIPVAMVNAAEFTASGYSGKSITQIGRYLLDAANGDVSLAEKGIVYIDEIDKIAGSQMNRGKDVGGFEVQKELLKIIEGEDLRIPRESEFFDDFGSDIIINTKNILFIFSGAFENLKNKESKISFCEETKENVEVTSDSLVEYGFLREFVGRVPLIVELERLEINDIVDILTKAENNLISQYKKMFAYDNIELDFTEDAVYEIAKTSYNKNIGARGLKSIMGNIMNKLLYQSYEKKDTKICITKDMIISLMKKNDKNISENV